MQRGWVEQEAIPAELHPPRPRSEPEILGLSLSQLRFDLENKTVLLSSGDGFSTMVVVLPLKEPLPTRAALYIPSF